MELSVAILQADSVREELQPEFGDYPMMFCDLLEAALGPGETLRVRTWRVTQGEYPDDLDECDGFIITGSRQSVYEDDPWIEQLQSWIVRAHAELRPLIGICFGHQLIAQALGGSTRAYPGGWGVGVHTTTCSRSKLPDWMVSEGQETGSDPVQWALVVSHQDQVDRLPEGAERLGGSEFCMNAAFTVGEHILTFQGHPEFPRAYARALMDQRRAIIGERTHEAGINSLALPTDALQVGRWMLDFIAASAARREALS